MEINRRLAKDQNYNAANAVSKENLLLEQEILKSRYNRGFDWASRFSESALDAYMADKGVKAICARLVEISEELISLS